jgi:two-component system, OmpR family, response regulator
MSSLLRQAFREDGYAVDVESLGSEALWRASETDFDAVILDVGLPDISGFEVCRELRGRGRWMPILMLTARDAVQDLVQGLDCGADDYVTKPFELRRAPGAAARAGPADAGAEAGHAGGR